MLRDGLIFSICASLFAVFAAFIVFENRHGRRILLPQIRSWLDRQLSAAYLVFRAWLRQIIEHTIKLSWYYSLHSALKASLVVVVKMYDSLELLLINNRERARKLRAEQRALKDYKNHLLVIKEHKASIALSNKEKKRLRAKSLSGE